MNDEPEIISTWRAVPRFRVIEGGDVGEPLGLMIEFSGGDDIPPLADGWVWLGLAHGVTFEKAVEICRLLNRQVRVFGYAEFQESM